MRWCAGCVNCNACTHGVARFTAVNHNAVETSTRLSSTVAATAPLAGQHAPPLTRLHQPARSWVGLCWARPHRRLVAAPCCCAQPGAPSSRPQTPAATGRCPTPCLLARMKLTARCEQLHSVRHCAKRLSLTFRDDAGLAGRFSNYGKHVAPARMALGAQLARQLLGRQQAAAQLVVQYVAWRVRVQVAAATCAFMLAGACTCEGRWQWRHVHGLCTLAAACACCQLPSLPSAYSRVGLGCSRPYA